MKTENVLKNVRSFIGAVLFVLVSVTLFACSADDEAAPVNVNTRAVASITVSGVITGTNNWSGTVYLDGKVFLVNGTLNIAAGTKIIGMTKSTPEEASALVITKTGIINAVGTAASPIVFKGETETKGAWGGLVILGTAAINQTTPQVIEGITSEQAGDNDITYGTPAVGLSQDQVDNINSVSSGQLSYVRVEFAGASIGQDNELNGFTFGGVGCGTELNHLQAYYGADDGFEFFGGAVNAKYLISTSSDDDAFDFDFGYQGRLQFLLAVIDPDASFSSDANGIECDNNKEGALVAPYTRPVISNLTIVGTSTGSASGTGTVLYGTRFRRATRFALCNSVVYGYNTVVRLDGSDVYDRLGTNASNICSSDSSFLSNNVIGLINGATAYDPSTAVTVNSNTVSYSAITLNNPFNYLGFFSTSGTNNYALRPTANPALTGADFTGLNCDSACGWIFDTTTYKGAVAPSGDYWIAADWVNKDFPY